MWAWGYADVFSANSVFDVHMGNSLETFFEAMSSHPNVIAYFHNLAFDGSFILDALLRAGFKHVQNGDYVGRRRFTTMISNTGKFYSIKVTWGNGTRTEFRDSWKKLPMSVKGVARAFQLEEAKGTIDYHAYRAPGHELTYEERNYLALDVLIVAKALRVQFEQGMTKLTVGSDALSEYKSLTGSKSFTRLFPLLPIEVDAEIRSAYRGGFTYADPRFKMRECGAGKTFDVNSLYPSVMYHELLPYGVPEPFKGAYEYDPEYPLYVQQLTFTARLKPDHIPCIQVKNSPHFLATQYQTEINEPLTMITSSVDLELWQKHYDMEILEYHGGWKFRGITGLFKDYIDKWMKVKATSKGGLRALAKLQLNSLYGKFATNPNVTGKVPYLKDNVVHLSLGPEEMRDPVYTPMGVFITAYARRITITAAQDNYATFAYADTDSLHLICGDEWPDLNIHPSELGAWKHEFDFISAFYARAKAYSELVEGEQKGDNWEFKAGTGVWQYVTHVAGMPEDVARRMTFKDFVNGRKFEGKLQPKRVPGGIVLVDRGFTFTL